MSARARLSTSVGRAAALGVVDVACDSASDLDAVLAKLDIPGPLTIGEVRLTSLAGVDRGLAIRWTQTFAQLTPHGGIAVTTKLIETIRSRGIEIVDRIAPQEAYPEARSPIEARALESLARAPSPLGVDLLLAQHDRWASGTRATTSPGTERDLRLQRLIDPALVVVAGPPNVGKSTLLNALAGRELALTADESGTTRDHVGALIDVGGLVVRWSDTPGLREASGVESEAIEIARELIASCDLLIVAGDALSGDPRGVMDREPDLTLGLRSDLGEPDWPCDARISIERDEGVGALARLVREALVPTGDLDSPEPWKFWAEDE